MPRSYVGFDPKRTFPSRRFLGVLRCDRVDWLEGLLKERVAARRTALSL